MGTAGHPNDKKGAPSSSMEQSFDRDAELLASSTIDPGHMGKLDAQPAPTLPGGHDGEKCYH